MTLPLSAPMTVPLTSTASSGKDRQQRLPVTDQPIGGQRTDLHLRAQRQQSNRAVGGRERVATLPSSVPTLRTCGPPTTPQISVRAVPCLRTRSLLSIWVWVVAAPR